MNRNDFLRIIDDSGPYDRNTIGEVNELLEIFPYFQSAYMLLLRGMQNTGDVKFNNQLKTSALHIADREVLYYFLNKEKLLPENNAIHEVSASHVETDNTDHTQVVIDTARNSKELINEIEKSSAAEESEDNGSGGGLSGHAVIVSDDYGVDESSATILLLDEESGEVEEKIIFMDPGFSAPAPQELLELDTEDSTAVVADDHSDSDSEANRSAVLSSQQIQHELIDRFILANPRIEQVREKSDAPLLDISQQFVENKGEFVTETLAKIYIRQGYYSRAIGIYEELSLKYPEKSSYFASQIEKVNDLIKKQ